MCNKTPEMGTQSLNHLIDPDYPINTNYISMVDGIWKSTIVFDYKNNDTPMAIYDLMKIFEIEIPISEMNESKFNHGDKCMFEIEWNSYKQADRFHQLPHSSERRQRILNCSSAAIDTAI